MVELIRLSGYRLQGLPPEQLAYRWAALREEMKKYVPHFQQLEMGYYLDDGDKPVPIIDLLMGKLQKGEVYIIHSKGDFVGIAAITDIAWGRSAYIEGIAVPKFKGSLEVGKAIGELITYAFNDYGDGGLGLKKLKATVISENIAGLKKAKKVGFIPAGILQAEALHMGVPHAMILLELLNPKFFSVDTKVLSDERSAPHTELPTDQLREPTATTASADNNGECAPGDDTSTDRNGGTAVRVDDAAVASVIELQRDSKPVSTRRTRRTVRPSANATDAKLVSAKRDKSASISTNGSKPNAGRRIRKQRSGSSRTAGSRRTTARIPSRTRS